MTHINKALLSFNFTLKSILPKLKQEVFIHTHFRVSLSYIISNLIYIIFFSCNYALCNAPSSSPFVFWFEIIIHFHGKWFYGYLLCSFALALFGIQHQSSVAKRKASKRSSFGNRNNFWFQRVQHGLNDWLIDDQSVYYKMKWNLSKEKVSIFLLFPHILHLLKKLNELIKN